MRTLLLACALALPTAALAQDGAPSPSAGPGQHGPGGPDGGPGGHGGHGGGRLFISPMGEPFRGPDAIGAWFDGADRNHDGIVTEAEFIADADRWFLVLDRQHDGEIDPDDIEYYETELAPEIRTGGDFGGGGARGGGGGKKSGGGGRHGGHGGGGMGGGGGGRGGGGEDEESGSTGTPSVAYDDVARGAAHFSFFNYPEPVTAADANLNRGVDITEFRNAAAARFDMLDKKGDGKLTRDELPTLSAAAGRGAKPGRHGGGRHGGGGGRSPASLQPD